MKRCRRAIVLCMSIPAPYRYSSSKIAGTREARSHPRSCVAHTYLHDTNSSSVEHGSVHAGRRTTVPRGARGRPMYFSLYGTDSARTANLVVGSYFTVWCDADGSTHYRITDTVLMTSALLFISTLPSTALPPASRPRRANRSAPTSRSRGADTSSRGHQSHKEPMTPTPPCLAQGSGADATWPRGALCHWTPRLLSPHESQLFLLPAPPLSRTPRPLSSSRTSPPPALMSSGNERHASCLARRPMPPMARP